VRNSQATQHFLLALKNVFIRRAHCWLLIGGAISIKQLAYKALISASRMQAAQFYKKYTRTNSNSNACSLELLHHLFQVAR
jgi:hypothetical protein